MAGEVKCPSCGRRPSAGQWNNPARAPIECLCGTNWYLTGEEPGARASDLLDQRGEIEAYWWWAYQQRSGGDGG